MDAKVIRTEEQYRGYLEEVQALIAKVPAVGSKESDRLELLTVLIEAYEARKFPIEAPDPVDAILFRMQEKGLRQADLIPYFGSRSRVSEVLGRKRPLTVQMIRALSLGLGLSAETLVGLSTSEKVSAKQGIDWSKFPVREMTSRGWLEKISARTSDGVEELVRNFISEAGLQFGTASFRRTLSGEADSPATRYALYAWLARVIQQARTKKAHLGKYEEGAITAGFMKELARLSWFEQGPVLATQFLERHGVAVIFEPHLKGTQLDGAALRDADGMPIVAMTLRYDRLDNFWFTLLHEVAHLWKHVATDNAFVDDLNASSEDKREAEANRLAKEAFIPRIIWKRSDAYISPSKENIDKLSRELKIHPAIIAGRIRKESGNYGLFADLIGQYEVRAMFPSLLESEC